MANPAPHVQGIPPQTRWQRNREHWSTTLDTANLRRSEKVGRLERDVALYASADVLAALDALEPLQEEIVLDLGGGNALAAVLLARRGARVIICDLSIPRLKQARVELQRLGLGDRVHCVAAQAENLPLRDHAVKRIFTKSVLIHTQLEQASAECGRVLAPEGRAAFIEPMKRNPFVKAYRLLLAPRAWRGITTYFSRGQWVKLEWGLCAGTGRTIALRPFHFLGFFSSLFRYAMPVAWAARLCDRLLGAFDGALFKVAPDMARRAWFGLMIVTPGQDPALNAHPAPSGEFVRVPTGLPTAPMPAAIAAAAAGPPPRPGPVAQ